MVGPPPSTRTQQNEALGIALMIAFLGGWITLAVILQVIQVRSHGYGGGIGDGGHVPQEVRAQLGVPADYTATQIMRATNR